MTTQTTQLITHIISLEDITNLKKGDFINIRSIATKGKPSPYVVVHRDKYADVLAGGGREHAIGILRTKLYSSYDADGCYIAGNEHFVLCDKNKEEDLYNEAKELLERGGIN
ncbi:MAG: hypothetical protein Q7S74_01850 [Nanoarchaeota archaeon]|nr:hypothetical protein [Nanoarchaeota archaeon]